MYQPSNRQLSEVVSLYILLCHRTSVTWLHISYPAWFPCMLENGHCLGLAYSGHMVQDGRGNGGICRIVFIITVFTASGCRGCWLLLLAPVSIWDQTWAVVAGSRLMQPKLGNQLRFLLYLDKTLVETLTLPLAECVPGEEVIIIYTLLFGCES